jgi:DNA repair photolyase
MGKMFTKDGKRVRVWNPVTGCVFSCQYCWAKKLVDHKLGRTKKYRDVKFTPAFHEKEMNATFGRNNTYFVVDVGDMWSSVIPEVWINKVIEKLDKAHPSNEFWFLTKNPERYAKYFLEHNYEHRTNFVLGATIEGTWDYPNISKAPFMEKRYKAMTNTIIAPYRKFLSIEPVLKFDLKTFVGWIKEIKPEFVYIGFDNYKKLQPAWEPTQKEVDKLIEAIKDITEVRLKTMRREKDDKKKSKGTQTTIF